MKFNSSCGSPNSVKRMLIFVNICKRVLKLKMLNPDQNNSFTNLCTSWFQTVASRPRHDLKAGIGNYSAGFLHGAQIRAQDVMFLCISLLNTLKIRWTSSLQRSGRVQRWGKFIYLLVNGLVLILQVHDSHIVIWSHYRILEVRRQSYGFILW